MKFRLILLFLLWYTCANAQVALVYDSIGEIQTLPIKDEDDSTPYLRQFSFTCIDRQSNRQITLTPDSCYGYRFSSHMLYASKTFEYAGETKRLFLRRVRVYQDSIVRSEKSDLFRCLVRQTEQADIRLFYHLQSCHIVQPTYTL